MRHNPQYDFKYLKARIGIDKVLSAYGLESSLKRRKHQLYGPCPIHHGDNPSAFRVNLQRNLWHCFTACGGGDIVDLVRRVENCSYAQAARRLQQLLDYAPPSPATPDKVCNHTHENNAFHPFRMKIPLNPNVVFLQNIKGISRKTALYFNAGSTDRSSFLRNTASVRLHDMTGSPLGYCGRRLVPDEILRWGKWRFPRNYPKSQNLFNAHRALPYIDRGIVVVECPWAVMRLTQAGIPNVVSLLGTTASTIQINWLVKSPKVLLMLDGDQAGRKAAPHIAEKINRFTKVSIHELAEDKEPEDLSDDDLVSIVNNYLLFF